MRVWHEVVEVWREGAEWVCGLRLMRWRHRKGLLSQGTRRMDEGVAGSGGGVERKGRVAVASA